jgi:hypothetical protein
MSKEVTLSIVGVLVLVTPYLGLPMSWLAVLLPALGAIILVIAQIIRRQGTAPQQRERVEPPLPHDASPYIA